MVLKGKRILFISYNGMLDPLGQSQVIPYLRELSKRGVQFTLLSFERAAAFEPDGSAKIAELHGRLAADNIDWHWLRYHQRPTLPATMYDVANGVRYAEKLVRRNGIEMVHARSHIPATIGAALKRRLGIKLIFDLRGLMAEEYVDAKHWREKSIPYRLTKMTERRILTASDAVVTLTEKIWPIVKEWDGLRNREVVHEVVPCCADLELFRFSAEDRQRRRAELGLDSRRVLVYSGSIGGWYLTDKMADFFAEIVRERRDWHFLWLTTGPGEMIKKLMLERDIDAEQYTVKTMAPADVPSYLSASDAGLAFYRPAFSRLATSPVKVTEYLACGLPLIINAGIGDSDELITRENTGALVSSFNRDEYNRALITIESFVRNAEETRSRTREIAERLFDVRTVGVNRYARLYQALLNGEN
jgi:glycosyltransferase involved in cell wall biosynthesis